MFLLQILPFVHNFHFSNIENYQSSTTAGLDGMIAPVLLSDQSCDPGVGIFLGNRKSVIYKYTNINSEKN